MCVREECIFQKFLMLNFKQNANEADEYGEPGSGSDRDEML